MKTLLDENLSFKLKSKLRSDFLNLVHVSDIRLAGSEDSDIFEDTQKNNFTAIITNDEHYYWLIVLKGAHPKLYGYGLGI